jgi:hypothetical protein
MFRDITDTNTRGGCWTSRNRNSCRHLQLIVREREGGRKRERERERERERLRCWSVPSNLVNFGRNEFGRFLLVEVNLVEI